MLALETGLGAGSLTRLLILNVQDVLPSYNPLVVTAHPQKALMPNTTTTVCLL